MKFDQIPKMCNHILEVRRGCTNKLCFLNAFNNFLHKCYFIYYLYKRWIRQYSTWLICIWINPVVCFCSVVLKWWYNKHSYLKAKLCICIWECICVWICILDIQYIFKYKCIYKYIFVYQHLLRLAWSWCKLSPELCFTYVFVSWYLYFVFVSLHFYIYICTGLLVFVFGLSCGSAEASVSRLCWC